MDLSRTYQRRKLMLLTKLPVAVGLAGVALAANAVTYTPGTYTEKVNGHNAAFTVKVTVSKNKIEKIEYPDNLETIGVGKVALDKLSKKIIDRQSLGVDNVTGATITSFALKGAVKKALEQAKVSKADMAKLRTAKNTLLFLLKSRPTSLLSAAADPVWLPLSLLSRPVPKLSFLKNSASSAALLTFPKAL